MLTTTTPRLKRIAGQERLDGYKADTHKMLDRYRLADHEELKNTEKRTGQMLYHTDLIRRIEKLTHRRVWAEDSKHDSNVCGFYTSVPNPDKLSADFGKPTKKYICAFDKGPLTEFSHIVTDERDLPIKEKRGWRTVLTRLMQAKVLTWSQVVYGFGAGDDHASSERWNANSRESRAK
jgi:hypothetical protein